MPWSNIIAVTPASLVPVARYLVDVDHDHHEEYELTPIKVFGANSVEAFIAAANDAFNKNKNRRTKQKRPPTNAGSWFVVRTPDGTDLTNDERTVFDLAVQDEAGHGLGIMNRHINNLSKAEDLNLLIAAFDPFGELIRDREQHPIKSLRQRMDEVTRSLNVLRLAKGIRPIQTMQEVQADWRTASGKIDVIDELARSPRPPADSSNLKTALTILGYEIPIFDESRDYFEIKKPGKKARVKPFRISKFFSGIKVATARLRLALESLEPMPGLTLPIASHLDVTLPAVTYQGGAHTVSNLLVPSLVRLVLPSPPLLETADSTTVFTF